MSIDSISTSLIHLARDHEFKKPLALLGKTMEELGEVSEALLIDLGEIRHKEPGEPVMNEVADVYICLLSLLAKHYDELSPVEVAEKFNEAVELKAQKYAKVLKV